MLNLLTRLACAATLLVAATATASAQGFEKKNLNYSDFAKPIFSEAVTVQSTGPIKWIFLAGIGAENNDGSVAHVGDFVKQCVMTWEKIKKILADQGATVSDIVSGVVYITDMGNRMQLVPCNAQTFGDGPKWPATLVGINQLARPGMLIEIMITAAIPGR